MTKTIIVADPRVHAHLSQQYPQWDTQIPVPTVGQLWEGLNSGALSNQSEIVIFSDQYYDPSGRNTDLEVAVATMAPVALVMVIAYSPTTRTVFAERVARTARENNLDDGKVYFVDYENPVDDIDTAITEYSQARQGGLDSSQSVAVAAEETAPRRRGKIIVSTSSKGGSGKSTTALLLASQFARGSKLSVELGIEDHPLDVCVVDMDIRDGQIGFLVGQMSPTALNIRVAESITQETVLQNLVPAQKLGISALLAPKRPRTSEDTPPAFYDHVLDILRDSFDIVILDTSVNYLDPLLESVCYPKADVILFVTDLGVSSVYGMARWFVEVTGNESDGGMGIDKEKIGVVINKSMVGVHMDVDRFTQAALEAPLLVAIPSRPLEFLQAANTNRLDLLLEDPEIGNAFYMLSKRVLGKGNEYTISSLVADAPENAAPAASQQAGYQSPNSQSPRKRGLFGGKR